MADKGNYSLVIIKIKEDYYNSRKALTDIPPPPPPPCSGYEIFKLN